MILKAVAYFCNHSPKEREIHYKGSCDSTIHSACSRDISGGYSDGVPPLPIPNREVKPDRADGTAHPRESRSPPFYNKPRDSKETRGFVFSKALSHSRSGISLLKYRHKCLSSQSLFRTTPHNYRNRVAELLPQLCLQLRGVSREKPDLFHSGATDLPIVKCIKEIANRIILQKHSQSYAWRIDVALFFERYVQWIFGQSVKRIGGEMVCNPKYAGHGANFDWLLHYLEPDIVLKFAETQIIVDAKYKSYLYHKHSKSDTLRESFRNDLHQLLGYTAFSTEKNKPCVSVAPFSRFEVSKIQFRSPFSDATIEIYCIGIPLSASSLSETVNQLCKWCRSLP